MAERTNRSHNNLKPWERMGLKVGALVALGAVALAGCGSVAASADHAPAKVTASAPATPGSSESSPAPSETASSAPEMQETVLTKSQVYNEMTPADQALVEKDAKLSFDDFEQLSQDERAKVALVLSDAHKDEWLSLVGDLVIPGNGGQKLNHILMPYDNTYHDSAKELYELVMNSDPTQVTSANNSQPYLQTQIERSVAYGLAATGDPANLADAKKIIGGTIQHTGTEADTDTWGHLSSRISDLEQMSASKTNTAKYLGYPDGSAYEHLFYNATSGPFKGSPDVVASAFEVFDENTQSMQPGVNSDGEGGADYVVVIYTKSNGQPGSIWVEHQTGSASSFGELEPNPTS